MSTVPTTPVSNDESRKAFNVFFHQFVCILCTSFPSNDAFPLLKDIVGNMVEEHPSNDLFYTQFRVAILPFVDRIHRQDELLIKNREIPELAQLDIDTVWPTLPDEEKQRLWKHLQDLAVIVQQ